MNIKRLENLLFVVYQDLSIMNNKNPSLLEGNGGISLFMHYFEHYYRPSSKLAPSILSKSLEVMNKEYMESSFGEGFVGILWVVQHLKNNTLLESYDLKQFDEVVSVSLGNNMENNNYDLFYGVIGKGVYFLERLKKDKSASKYLNTILIFLNSTIVIDGQEGYWYNINKGNKVIDYGIAHGMPSIIIFLTKLYSSNINRTLVERLLIKGCNHFIKIGKLSKDAYFPQTSNDIENSRLAWCYGDLGVAIALLEAGQILKESLFINYASDIMENSCKRQIPQSGVYRSTNEKTIDSSFCHGTSGLSYLYDYYYQKTGKIKAYNQSQYWLNQTIIYFKNQNSFYTTKWDEINQQQQWYKNSGLLNGLAGIGLVLLSHCKKNYSWSNCFLLG